MHQDQRTLHGIRISTVELFESMTPINIGNIDYYSTVTIKALLKILIDPTLKNNHSLAIEAIGYIIKMLGTKCKNFLYLIIPAFVDIISISRHKFK
jgi:phosphatidylinositol kinase/protein kinase (PI-3  family)